MRKSFFLGAAFALASLGAFAANDKVKEFDLPVRVFQEDGKVRMTKIRVKDDGEYLHHADMIVARQKQLERGRGRFADGMLNVVQGMSGAVVGTDPNNPYYMYGWANVYGNKWPNSVVPYTIDNGFSAAQKTVITNAMAAWTNGTGLQFVPRNGEAAYMRVVSTKPNEYFTDPGSAEIGYLEGEHTYVYLKPSGLYPELAQHEIGHALGYWHEHQRSDRDAHLDMLPNFNYHAGGCSVLDYISKYNPYDTNSVMHYHSWGCSAATSGWDDSNRAWVREDGSTIHTQPVSQGDLGTAGWDYGNFTKVTGVSAFELTNIDCSFQVSWNSVANAVEYGVYEKSGTKWILVATKTNTYADITVGAWAQGTTRQYGVRAFNSAGVGSQMSSTAYASCTLGGLD